jgi:hypothetical protein
MYIYYNNEKLKLIIFSNYSLIIYYFYFISFRVLIDQNVLYDFDKNFKIISVYNILNLNKNL